MVQHFSRAKWLPKLTPGTAYAKYVAAGSDVAADGLKGQQGGVRDQGQRPAAAASVATSSMTLDGTYLVSSMTMPTTSPSCVEPGPGRAVHHRPGRTRDERPGRTRWAPPCPSSRRWTRPSPTWDMGTGFSRAGLIDQLSSSAGDQFSVADATWAVDHSGADWYAQAVMSAKGYMKMGGFGRASHIDQLTSSAGEQFTLAQATYAVNQVGL